MAKAQKTCTLYSLSCLVYSKFHKDNILNTYLNYFRIHLPAAIHAYIITFYFLFYMQSWMKTKGPGLHHRRNKKAERKAEKIQDQSNLFTIPSNQTVTPLERPLIKSGVQHVLFINQEKLVFLESYWICLATISSNVDRE